MQIRQSSTPGTRPLGLKRFMLNAVLVYLILLFVPRLRIFLQAFDRTANALFHLVSRCLHNLLHTVVANKVKVIHGSSHDKKTKP